MQGPESVNLQSRPNLIYVEGGGNVIKVAPEQGKALGLREGQIINGIIASRPEGNTLRIGNYYLTLPSNFGVVGEKISIKIAVGSGGFILRKIFNLTARGEAKSQGAAAKRFQNLLNLVGKPTSESLISDTILDRLSVALKSNERLRNLLSLQALQVSSLSPEKVKNLIENSGLFHEALLRKGIVPTNPGLKSLLLEARRYLFSSGLDSTAVTAAIDELDMRQIETLLAQSNGNLSLSWVLPFLGAPPANIQISYDEQKTISGDAEEKHWTIKIDIAHKKQHCSFQINLFGYSVELSCWTLDTNLLELIKKREEDLRNNLLSSGLYLKNLTCFLQKRTASVNATSKESFGGLLDRNV